MKKYRIIILGAGILIASLFSIQDVCAQQATKHTVQTGETLTKIAKAYGTTVGDIMRFNGMNTQSKLEVGQSIKIPPAGVHIVGKSSTDHEEAAPATASNQPNPNAGHTHTVVAGESLYKISKAFNVKVADIKKWNNLTDNNIKVGQVLQMSDTPATPTQNVPTSNVPESSTSGIIVANPKPEPEKKGKTESVKVVSSETTTLANNGGGAFASGFGQDAENQTLANVSGKAKIFKSQSGWSDQKFYIMMNDVTPGAIVKVTYNGVSVFAKVLWNLIDTKENTGLAFRLSDATASALGVTGDSFDLKVDYYK